MQVEVVLQQPSLTATLLGKGVQHTYTVCHVQQLSHTFQDQWVCLHDFAIQPAAAVMMKTHSAQCAPQVQLRIRT